MRSGLAIVLLAASLAACGHKTPEYSRAPAPLLPRDIPGEIKRNVDMIDDQVRFADNGLYNRFRWMTDGTFCYTSQSKTEILKYCFQPQAVDAASVAVRPAESLGAPYDRVALSCGGRACIKQSSQLTSMFGPRGYTWQGALSMPTRRGGGQATATALRSLLWLGSQPGAMPRME